jgi:Tol biopolymer transport system component
MVEPDERFCPMQLSEAVRAEVPSPDGAWKVRTTTPEDRGRHAGNGLVLSETATGRETLIPQPPELGEIVALRWSPDSRRIAVLDRRMAQVEYGTVSMVRLDGLTLTSVADYGGSLRSLVWSPDSSMVAYSSSEVIGSRGLGPVQVWVARADGSQPPAVVMDGCAPQWTGPTLSAGR